ncbi:phenylalanine--tRNA ligase beta subunit-related protein [Pantoea dispersa]|uniref:phenylalanine--tRNA ligase beta subunit-related protein n=1 Tax=Pantoea dispersa TaxID=59814 RepID=UPI00286BD673|nr:phenylalanine--tRNA ligase beta subunit-related protein [Pantoea dispersa]
MKLFLPRQEESEFFTAGEKLRSNFSNRGFRSINNVVDAYNEAAFFFGLGIGGHDFSNARKDAHLEIMLSSSEDTIVPLFDTRTKKINPGELIYKLEKDTVAWIGSKDVDSDEFRIGDETKSCAFVIIGHSSVTATDLYTVSARIRRNLVESSYDIDSSKFDSQEFYYNTRPLP